MSDDGSARKPQRPSLSCSECARRKIKCNKTIPCDPCIKRRASHACRVEGGSTSDPAPKPPNGGDVTPADNNDTFRLTVFAEIDVLRRRIFELEQLHPRVTALESKRFETSQAEPEIARTESSFKAGQADEQDEAVTLEFFALGADRRANRDGADQDPSTLTRPSTPTLNILDSPSAALSNAAVAALMPRHKVEPILSFATEACNWQYCCIQQVQFGRECAAFYDLLDMTAGPDRFRYVRPAWLALYLTIQALAVSQMSVVDAAHAGLAETEIDSLPGLLFDGCMSCLESARYMEEPSLQVLQTIAILVSCGRNLASQNLMSSLLAVGVKTAQSLDLHRLGRVDTGPRPPPTASREDRIAYSSRITSYEVGKRVFWTLTVQDWYSFTYRGASLISPRQFDTPLPLNCSDEDLEAGVLYDKTDSTPSQIFKNRFSAKLAGLLRNFFEDLADDDPARAYPTLLRVDKGIRQLLADLPAFLRSTAPSSSDRHLPSFVPSLRMYLHISLYHKLIVVHRAFLSTGQATPAQRDESHHASISAARAVIRELERNRHLNRAALWQIPYHAVSAASLLTLHLFRQGAQQEGSSEARGEIGAVLDTLRELGSTSIIARRGAEVLYDLLQEESRWAHDPQYRRKREAEGGVQGMVKRFKLPTGNAATDSTPSPQIPGQLGYQQIVGTLDTTRTQPMPATRPFASGTALPMYYDYNQPLYPSVGSSSAVLQQDNTTSSMENEWQMLERLLGTDMNINLLASSGQY